MTPAQQARIRHFRRFVVDPLFAGPDDPGAQGRPDGVWAAAQRIVTAGPEEFYETFAAAIADLEWTIANKYGGSALPGEVQSDLYEALRLRLWELIDVVARAQAVAQGAADRAPAWVRQVRGWEMGEGPGFSPSSDAP